MRILPAREHRSMPWKNGGGETLEIAISPAGATVEDFDWRLSMAKVLASGPFSLFKKADRILTVLDGAMDLAVADQPPVRLTADSAPYRFPGDAAARADVLGAVTDLNVMVRRGAFSAEVRRLDRTTVEGCEGEAFVIIRSSARLQSGQALECNDVLQLARAECALFTDAAPDGWLVEIRAVSA